MDSFEAKLKQYQPQIISICRIMLGLLIMQHGCTKFFGFPQPAPANLTLMLILAGLIEVIGGALVVVGLFTRLAAVILSGEMAVAYLIYANRLGVMPWAGPSGNNRVSFIPALNGGNTEVIYCFAFLLIAAVGAGIWSLDAMYRKKT